MPKLTALAFDYGTRQIGVAFGQPDARVASPIGIVPAKDGIPDWVEVKKLLAEWKPTLLLVGLPLNMDDTESEMCLRARKFARRLHGRFGLTVQMIDERLTSFEARQQNPNNKWVDAEAAALLLNSWFDNPEFVKNP